jgi:hypothetical protein
MVGNLNFLFLIGLHLPRSKTIPWWKDYILGKTGKFTSLEEWETFGVFDLIAGQK